MRESRGGGDKGSLGKGEDKSFSGEGKKGRSLVVEGKSVAGEKGRREESRMKESRMEGSKKVSKGGVVGKSLEQEM